MNEGDVLMKNMYDVMQLLKRYHLFIYTGDRIGDLDLMELELAELKEANIIEENEFYLATLIMRREKRRLLER